VSSLRHDALPPGIPWLTLTALGLLVAFAVWLLIDYWFRMRRFKRLWGK